jgi:hypothetical protein
MVAPRTWTVDMLEATPPDGFPKSIDAGMVEVIPAVADVIPGLAGQAFSLVSAAGA